MNNRLLATPSPHATGSTALQYAYVACPPVLPGTQQHVHSCCVCERCISTRPWRHFTRVLTLELECCGENVWAQRLQESQRAGLRGGGSQPQPGETPQHTECAKDSRGGDHSRRGRIGMGRSRVIIAQADGQHCRGHKMWCETRSQQQCNVRRSAPLRVIEEIHPLHVQILGCDPLQGKCLQDRHSTTPNRRQVVEKQ
jgi:hypothetical protein